MELTPQAVWEFAELNNIVNRLLAQIQASYNPRILSLVVCALHNNCQDLRWRDETIARGVDSLVRVISATRAGVTNKEELRAATLQLKTTLESQSYRWSFKSRLAG